MDLRPCVVAVADRAAASEFLGHKIAVSLTQARAGNSFDLKTSGGLFRATLAGVSPALPTGSAHRHSRFPP